MDEKTTVAQWADAPFQLITTPYTYKDVKSHNCVRAASTMASIHNMLIRGINAMVVQGPHVASADQQSYNEQDVLDFLKYIEIWTSGLEHHHHIEETILFPRWEELFASPGLLTGAEEEHEAFHEGLVRLAAEAKHLQQVPKEYRWSSIKDIIDSFAEALVFHLKEEIELILSFEKFDSDLLWKGWMEAENVAKTDGGIAAFYTFMPWMFSHSDSTYEGGNTFPDVPAPIRWACKLYFGRRHAGVWRFAPCDLNSQPHALAMLPENSKQSDL